MWRLDVHAVGRHERRTKKFPARGKIPRAQSRRAGVSPAPVGSDDERRLARELNKGSGEETMSHHTRLLGGFIVGAVLVCATAFADNARQDSSPTQSMDGGYLFRTYCGACHGTSARGDGPLADSLRRRPPNLTEILKREGGTFPKDKVFRIIDGRQRVAGHGGPDMPVWGDAFRRSIDGGDEANVKQRIEAIVKYLEGLQVRSGE